MIIVAGTLRLSPEDLASVRDAARTVLTETRKETGCRVYSFAEDLLEPGLVRIYEEWDTRADLDAHARAPHIADWHKVLSGVTILKRELSVIEAGAVEPLG
ncbi:putative quinol monooxygenase [Jiella marina]|uniref:putative quinol monooxygenase n=1 Tax=Jiella sp. LLJ827 TaxID=2917712 RepID=UPI002101A275|nr:putative quinol monooxygenase [Jiella sp. LLJ827]MCQ0989161.1 antibiotic biosynthesis monooxygenase [Jiella sp. LLJ827]